MSLKHLCSPLALASILVAPVEPPQPGPITTAPLPPIVFVSRHPICGQDGRPEPGAIPGIGPRDRTARVGGRLLVREPDGTLRVLAGPPALFDVADPSVSWDGTRVLFSGVADRDSSWRIFEVGADGSGLRQVTRSDRAITFDQFGPAAARFVRYDDIDPCWLPDGRIVFASTRWPLVSELGEHLVTNLFTVDSDGSRPRRITSERDGGEEPAIDPITGRVVFSRWLLNLDRPSDRSRNGLTYLDDEALTSDVGNVWQTLSVLPDGRTAQLHAGDPRSRRGLICYKPALLPDGRVLTVYAANGAFDPAPGPTGIRVFAAGADTGQAVIGFSPRAYAELGRSGAAPEMPEGPWATDPVPLPGRRIAASISLRGDGDFGLYACRLDGTALEPLVDLPGTLELDAAALAPVARPPVIPVGVDPNTAELPPTEDPATFARAGSFRFDCMNVFANAPVDSPIPDAPPITRGSRLRLFMNFQRHNPSGRDPSIPIRDARITPFGAVHEQGIPADLPFFGQVVDAGGRVVVGRDGAPAHVAEFGYARRGGWAQCVGCHVGHSVMVIPHNYSDAEWFNVSTSARVEASSEWRPAGRTSTPMRSARVTDRRARVGGLDAAWVARGRDREWVRLSWELPIEVEGLVLYGIGRNESGRTDVRVEECRVCLLRGGTEVLSRATGAIAPSGTRLTVPRTLVDEVRIEIVRSSGRVRGEPRTGLAEIETIARLALEEPRP